MRIRSQTSKFFFRCKAKPDYSVSVLGSHVVIAASTPWEFRWEFLRRSEDIYEEKIGSFQRFIIFSPFPFLRQSTSIVFKKSIHSDEFHSSFVNYLLNLLDNFEWKLNTHVWNFNKIAHRSKGIKRVSPFQKTFYIVIFMAATILTVCYDFVHLRWFFYLMTILCVVLLAG